MIRDIKSMNINYENKVNLTKNKNVIEFTTKKSAPRGGVFFNLKLKGWLNLWLGIFYKQSPTMKLKLYLI
jgi:hypothetical protein